MTQAFAGAKAKARPLRRRRVRKPNCKRKRPPPTAGYEEAISAEAVTRRPAAFAMPILYRRQVLFVNTYFVLCIELHSRIRRAKGGNLFGAAWPRAANGVEGVAEALTLALSQRERGSSCWRGGLVCGQPGWGQPGSGLRRWRIRLTTRKAPRAANGAEGAAGG
jgi:hypothetical protein